MQIAILSANVIRGLSYKYTLTYICYLVDEFDKKQTAVSETTAQ